VINLYSERVFRTVFFGCLLMVAFCLACAILSVSLSGPGQGNILKETFNGRGYADIQDNFGTSSSRVSIQNANISYEVTNTWANGDNKDEQISYVEISGAHAGSKFKNRVEIRSKGAGYAHYWGAFGIRGNFSGRSEITVITGSEANPAQLDSLIIMDGENATFQGRVYNSEKGRPATKSEVELAGSFVFESYLNVTDIPKTPEDWLGFCGEVSKGLPDGLLILPANRSTAKA
jgi:hypothetical protein